MASFLAPQHRYACVVRMNMIAPTDPMEREARFVRMVLVECFVGATTWSDMQKIGEALSKLNRIEKEMHAEWQHLNGSGSASGAPSMGMAASPQMMAQASSGAALSATASGAARQSSSSNTSGESHG